MDYKNESKQQMSEKMISLLRTTARRFHSQIESLLWRSCFRYELVILKIYPSRCQAYFPVIRKSVNICCITMLDQALTKQVPQNIL